MLFELGAVIRPEVFTGTGFMGAGLQQKSSLQLLQRRGKGEGTESFAEE